MKLNDLKEVSENINLDEYLELYKYVRENMEHPEWLGTFERDEIKEILALGGKIWMYYDGKTPVCSVFYIPVKNKTLRKHNIEYDESITGSLGPIMVRNEYVKKIGKTHMFTKAHSDNIYSIKNILKDGYKVINEYTSERGPTTVFIK